MKFFRQLDIQGVLSKLALKVTPLSPPLNIRGGDRGGLGGGNLQKNL